MIRRTTRLESCPSKVRTRQANRDRATASGSASLTTPPKAPSKANLQSKQGLESQELKSETAGAEGRKQSQSSKGGDDQKAEVARLPTGSEEWPAAGGQ